MRTKTAIEIYAYWDELRGHRDVPLRAQVEPAHIRNILADLFILEKNPAGDIRFRLAGTRMCSLFVRELRGATFDSLWLGDQTARLNRIADEVMKTMSPAVMSGAALTAAGERLMTELVLLPLRSSEGVVDRIIGALAPLSRPTWIGVTPVNYLELQGIRMLDIAKTNLFLQNRPEVRLPSPPKSTVEVRVSNAIRRVLHLQVLEGGRQD